MSYEGLNSFFESYTNLKGSALITDGPAKRDYKELIYLGQFNPVFRRERPMSTPKTHCKPSLLKGIDIDYWNDLSQYCGRYFYNRPCEVSVEKAEMKIDEPRPWPKMDMFREQAQRIADRMLEVPLTAKSYTDQETLDHLDLTKGCSLPWRILGFKTRGDLYKSDIWTKVRDDSDALKDLLPFYESCGKEELAEYQDFLDSKVRTFQTTCAHLLYWQIRLYGRGNENLKNYRWSKYGFNPFYGGTDKWYREIVVRNEDGTFKFPIRICWDISGYDRKIFLTYVAYRRLKCWINANPGSPFLKIAEWVSQAWIKSILVFLNGDIVIRTRGNNSGSGTTTTNNIEAGFEVVSDLLSFVYYTKYNSFPNDELVIEQLIALFGDDNAMYLMDEFILMTDEKLVKERLFQQHGLVCKWLVGGIEHPFNELPFLGFTFSSYKSFFIPKWNIKRLVHPILYTPTKKSIGQYLQQVYALMIMSFAHFDVYVKIRLVYIKLLQYYSDSGTPEVKTMIRLGVPTIEEVEQFYLGFENSSRIPLKWVSGGGGPKFINMDSRDNNSRSEAAADDLLHECIDIITPDNVDKIPQSMRSAFRKWMEWRRENEDLLTDPTYTERLDYCISYLNEGLAPDLVKRKITKRMEGSGDEYGNQQTSDTNSISIFRNGYTNTQSGSLMCYSTILYDDINPRVISGEGNDAVSAFEEWYLLIQDIASAWAPEIETPLGKLLEKYAFEHKVDFPKKAFSLFSHVPSKSYELTSPKENNFSPGLCKRYTTLFKPVLQSVDVPDSVTVYKYVYNWSMDGGPPIIGGPSAFGINPESAFTYYLSDLTDGFLEWSPMDAVRKFVIELRKLSPPPIDHPLSFVWTSDVDHTCEMIKLGFNPYGNGQPKMSYPQYLARNKVQFDREKLTSVQRKAKFNEYLRAPPPKPKVMTTVKQDNHNKIVPTKKQYEKAINSQIGSANRKVRPMSQDMASVKKLRSGITVLSKCSRYYFCALLCPFWWTDEVCEKLVRSLKLNPSEKENPCIPTIPNVKSRKTFMFSRGEFAMSATGSGFITFAPRRLASDCVGSSYNSCPLYYSSIAWVAPSGCIYPNVDANLPMDFGIISSSLNSDYTSSSLPLVNGRGIKYRVVGAGMRIRYIGKEVDRSGLIHALITPNHDTVSGLNVVNAGNYETYFRWPVAREWVTITHTPVMDDDFLYFPDSINNPAFFGTIFSTQSFQHYMGFQITDCLSGSFEYEAIAHYEIVGSEVRGLTPTPVDMPGISAVLNTTVPSVVPEVNKISQSGGDIGGILKSGMETVTGLAKDVLPLLA